MYARAIRGNMMAGDLRVMMDAMRIQRGNMIGACTESDDSKPQGKNARQSHPRQVPLNNGLRAMRPPESNALRSQRTTFLFHTHKPQYVSNSTHLLQC
jgi:hypothetical protein